MQSPPLSVKVRKNEEEQGREKKKQKKQKLILGQKSAASLDGHILVAARGMCVEGSGGMSAGIDEGLILRRRRETLALSLGRKVLADGIDGGFDGRETERDFN